MKRLNYRGTMFDSFTFTNNDCSEYVDESNIETLEGFIYDGWGYVCPHCIKKYDLYEDVGLTKDEVGQIIANEEEYKEDYICCVDGCNNKNAYETYFKLENCKLI